MSLPGRLYSRVIFLRDPQVGVDCVIAFHVLNANFVLMLELLNLFNGRLLIFVLGILRLRLQSVKRRALSDEEGAGIRIVQMLGLGRQPATAAKLIKYILWIFRSSRDGVSRRRGIRVLGAKDEAALLAETDILLDISNLLRNGHHVRQVSSSATLTRVRNGINTFTNRSDGRSVASACASVSEESR